MKKPESHIISTKDEAQKRLSNLINGEVYFPKSNEINLIKLIQSIPADLKKILISEMHLGNKIIEISKSGWPQENSIVINLKDRFKNKKFTSNVKFRVLNDHHYWLEEVMQIENKTTYLIIV